ncbi:unnamed protein product [Amoebophrya sp. A25]|nr:unnamed protein product [Amoebophrya sp. A25]|eukprot:GSA25T00015420001.1
MDEKEVSEAEVKKTPRLRRRKKERRRIWKGFRMQLINWRRILKIRGSRSELFEGCASPYINKKLQFKRDGLALPAPNVLSVRKKRRLMRRRRLVFDSESDRSEIADMATHKRYAISINDYKAWLDEAHLQGAEHGWAAWKASGYDEIMSLHDFRRGKGVWRRETITGKTRLSWPDWHKKYRSDFPDVAACRRSAYLAKLTRNHRLLQRAKLVVPGIHDLVGVDLGEALAVYVSTYEANTWVRLMGQPAPTEIAPPKKDMIPEKTNKKKAFKTAHENAKKNKKKKMTSHR